MLVQQPEEEHGQMDSGSLFGQHASTGKGTWVYDSLKFQKWNSENDEEKKFEEKNFDPKISENLCFWAFFTNIALNLVSLLSSIKLERPMIAQNFKKKCLKRMMKKIEKRKSIKKLKNMIFGPKMGKIDKVKKFCIGFDKKVHRYNIFKFFEHWVRDILGTIKIRYSIKLG